MFIKVRTYLRMVSTMGQEFHILVYYPMNLRIDEKELHSQFHSILNASSF